MVKTSVVYGVRNICLEIINVLFVSRYPQSADLREWLIKIPNRYIHFGDFDLAGICIYQSEFYKFLGDRAGFLIPEDIRREVEIWKCGTV